MKLVLGVAGVLSVLATGCVGLDDNPACEISEVEVLTEEDAPDAFEGAYEFESQVDVHDRFGSPPDIGNLTVVDIETMERQHDDGCTGFVGTRASVLVEVDAGEAFFVTLPATIETPDDGDAQIRIRGFAPLDGATRVPFTPRDRWRVSGVLARAQQDAVSVEVRVTPEVCEDPDDCEHNEYKAVSSLQLR